MPSPNQPVCKLSNPQPPELLQGIFRTSKNPHHQLVSVIAVLKTIAATLFWILWPWNTAPLLSTEAIYQNIFNFFPDRTARAG